MNRKEFYVTANVIHKGEILKAVLLKVRIKTTYFFFLITSIHHLLEVSGRAIGQEKIKHIQFGRQEEIISISDSVISYMQSSKKSTQNFRANK